MQRIARRISTTLYALGIVGALTFGASQAFGRAVQQTCPDDPPTHLGACGVGWNEECTLRCQAITGDTTSVGTCEAGGPLYGCCVCLMR